MATSGTFTASMGNYYDLVIVWSVSSQSIANNQSKVSLKYGTKKKKSGATSYNLSSKVWARSGSTYHLNGTTWGWDMRSAAVGDTYYFYTGTVTVNHNANGTGSLYVYGQIDVGSLSYASGATASGTITLPTIPRATTPKLSKTSADMGTAVTVDLSARAVSSFTHTLTYKLPSGATGTIADRTAATSVSWTVPDFASSIPNAVSGAVTVTCATYDAAGTKIGANTTVTLTATVPADVTPTIGEVSVSEAAEGIAERYGAYIQTKSQLAVTIIAEGTQGSTVKSVSSTVDGGVYSGTSWISGAIGGSGTVNIVTTVTDSRGRTAKKTTAVQVLAYSAPVISVFTAARCDEQGTAANDGNYALLRYAYSVPELNGGNTARMAVQAKLTAEEEYGLTLLTGEGLTADATAVSGTEVSSSYRWDVRITVTDSFGAVTAARIQLPTAEVVMDFRENGKGMAIGKTSEQDGLDIKWDVTFRGKTNLTPASIGTTPESIGAVNKAGDTMTGALAVPSCTVNGFRIPEIQRGSVTITPTAANTSTSVTVNFPKVFTGTPMVYLTAYATNANAIVGLSAINNTAAKVDVCLSRYNTGATAVAWLAIY